MQRAGQGIGADFELGQCVFLGKAPDFAPCRNGWLVVQVHLCGKVDRLALIEAGDDDAALGVIAEAGTVRHADPFVEDVSFGIRLQRLRHGFAQQVLVGFVGHDHEFAVYEPVRSHRITGACGRHRGKLKDLLCFHGRSLWVGVFW